MESKRNRYVYKGDVLIFGRVVYRNWKAETYASSAQKAAANLKHQYKKANGLAANASITLDAKPMLAG